MEFPVGFPQARGIDMGVNLRRRDIGMSQHLLNDAEVRAVGQQMARKRMPQCVRMDVFLDSGPGGGLLDYGPDALAVELPAVAGEKYERGGRIFRGQYRACLGEIALQEFERGFPDRHHAGFSPLPVTRTR